MTSFPIPADFKAPANVKDGEEFDSVATFKMDKGQLVLIAIAGSELEAAPAPEEDSEADFMGTMKKRMTE